ncbi:hypothetical protein ACQCVK_10635 [Rossellomorea vietnamensis]|uniref:hypothetical protein n=1 Tax=Rossellomorea vietnamensis TaxID=218284 RepID=UPI003CEB8038
MRCKECDGMLFVIRVEEVPKGKNYISYNRLCDVECISCKKVYYSQPYDSGRGLNEVRDISQKKESKFENND